jgi:hypothetical protein
MLSFTAQICPSFDPIPTLGFGTLHYVPPPLHVEAFSPCDPTCDLKNRQVLCEAAMFAHRKMINVFQHAAQNLNPDAGGFFFFPAFTGRAKKKIRRKWEKQKNFRIPPRIEHLLASEPDLCSQAVRAANLVFSAPFWWIINHPAENYPPPAAAQFPGRFDATDYPVFTWIFWMRHHWISNRRITRSLGQRFRSHIPELPSATSSAAIF